MQALDWAQRAAAPLSVLISVLFVPLPAWALPQGATLASGQASVTQAGAAMQISTSDRVILNWQQFSIGAGESVRFIQPAATSAVLNRVTGATASILAGNLSANGRVFLVNPNGIVVGPDARIDTNAFVASTLNMTDEDFLNDRLRFAGGGTGSIRNEGSIVTPAGGHVILVAPEIENRGLISTPEGRLILAAGQSVEIGDLQFANVSFQLQAPEDRIVNVGQLIADGGVVGAFAGSLRNAGTIRANRLGTDGDGTVRIMSAGDIHLDAGSVVQADGGDVSIQSVNGAVYVDGSISTGNDPERPGWGTIWGNEVRFGPTAGVSSSIGTMLYTSMISGGAIISLQELPPVEFVVFTEAENYAVTLVTSDATGSNLAGAGSGTPVSGVSGSISLGGGNLVLTGAPGGHITLRAPDAAGPVAALKADFGAGAGAVCSMRKLAISPDAAGAAALQTDCR